MKTITIRLTDVEAAVLLELVKSNKNFKGPGQMMAEMLRVACADIRKARK